MDVKNINEEKTDLYNNIETPHILEEEQKYPYYTPFVENEEGTEIECTLLDKLQLFYMNNKRALHHFIEIVTNGSSSFMLNNKTENDYFISENDKLNNHNLSLNGKHKISHNSFNYDVNISLRTIDFFVTSYTKLSNQCMFKIDDTLSPEEELYYEYQNEIRSLDIYGLYKRELQYYNKRLFDPFARIIKNGGVRRIRFYYAPKLFICTTAAQLNFFRWFISTDLFPIVYKNIFYIKQQIKIKDELKKNRSNNKKNQNVYPNKIEKSNLFYQNTKQRIESHLKTYSGDYLKISDAFDDQVSIHDIQNSDTLSKFPDIKINNSGPMQTSYDSICENKQDIGYNSFAVQYSLQQRSVYSGINARNHVIRNFSDKLIPNMQTTSFKQNNSILTSSYVSVPNFTIFFS